MDKTFLSKLKTIIKNDNIKCKPLELVYDTPEKYYSVLRTLLYCEIKHQITTGKKLSNRKIGEIIISPQDNSSISIISNEYSNNDLIYVVKNKNDIITVYNYGIYQESSINGDKKNSITWLFPGSINTSYKFIGKVINLITFHRIDRALRRKTLKWNKYFIKKYEGNEEVQRKKYPQRLDKYIGKLNESQISGIDYVISNLDREGFYLIHGPPGTGKTTTLIQILKEILQNDEYSKNNLLTSTCNLTISKLCYEIIKHHVFSENQYFVVIGNQEQVSESIHNWCMFTYVKKTKEFIKKVTTYFIKLNKNINNKLTIDYIENISSDDEVKLIYKDLLDLPTDLVLGGISLRKDLEDLINVWDKFWESKLGEFLSLNTFGTIDTYEISERINNIIKVCNYFKETSVLINYLLKNTNLVICTLSVSGIQLFDKYPFHRIIIDEAAQAIQTETLIPISNKTNQVIMIGDPLQRSGFVQNEKLRKLNYDCSLMKRLMNLGHHYILLDEQYRMHPEISKFPSEYIYQGKIKNSKYVVESEEYRNYPLDPYQVINIDGCEIKDEFGSYYNIVEAKYIVNCIEEIVAKGIAYKDIVVITTYQAQKKLIEGQVDSDVHTVDSYQGQESDVVILSTVRCDLKLGFLDDICRLNVALTRAKKSFWIIGHLETLTKSSDFKKLIDDARCRGCIKK
jgi:DNA polymerase III delta prime subunit